MMNLVKNIKDIFQDKYIIPLYQRNFAWGEEEINQLLQDIYSASINNPNGNYFVGSLVVLKRDNGDFEVIDGQQRLTAITLITKVLDIEKLDNSKLFYDSRPEVERFFYTFYNSNDSNDFTFDHKVEHLIDAIEYIKNTNLDPSKDEDLTILLLKDSNEKLRKFKKYFANNVKLVRIEIPTDTDVASYFEIMNNRGIQLHKHEILKALLLGHTNIKNMKDQQKILSKIWDACSQMDLHIQKLFNSDKRAEYFGNEYNTYLNIQDRFLGNNEIIEDNDKKEKFTINYVLDNSSLLCSSFDEHAVNGEDTDEDTDDESDSKSIIDFPNFLMHIFRLLYNDKYKKRTQKDIPLNEKYLIEVFLEIESEVDPVVFIQELLFYKTVFDRYILKSKVDNKSEDGFRWSLMKPYKYNNNGKNALKFKNTFDEQDRVLQSLSMLQVTFRTRIYKNWLNEVLSWFDSSNFLMDKKEFQKKIDELILNYYENTKYKHELTNEVSKDEALTKDNSYSIGVSTPHFLFNFIDYLYWIQFKFQDAFTFDFKYRNSIEHHLPQSFENNENMLDNLGNLCLVSKSLNSRMNNESPIGKADPKGKFYKINLPAKQRIMYDITNQNGWTEKQIKEHYNDVVSLLNARRTIVNS